MKHGLGEPREDGRSCVPTRTGSVILTAIALLLTGVAIAPPVATASAAAVAADAQVVPFSFSFAANPAEGVNPGGCEAAIGSTGTHECNGTFTDPDATEPFTSTTDLATGSASWTRTDGSDTAELSVTTLGGELYGTYDTTDPTSLTVTGGLAAWTTGMTTLDDGSAPGQPGGPLQLSVTSTCTDPTTECTATISATGYVVADPPPPPTPTPNGQEWVTFSLIFTSTIRLPYLEGGCTDKWLETSLTCDGLFVRGDPPTRFPFDSGAGTLRASPYDEAVEFAPVEIFAPGAEIDGGVPDESSSRFDAYRILVPWGTDVHSGARSDLAAGSQGAPLYLDVERIVDGWKGPWSYQFVLSGWVLRTPVPPGAGAPSDGSTAATTTTTITTMRATGSASADAVATEPRFAG